MTPPPRSRASAPSRPDSGGFRSLADDLRGRSPEELADLLEARPDLARSSSTDLAGLAAAATTPTSVQRALEGLTRPELQALEAVLVLAPVDAAAVAHATGAPSDEARTCLAHLVELALLWRSPEGLRPLRTITELIPRPAGLAGAQETGSTPPPEVTPAVLAGLPSPERALLDALLWGPPVGQVTEAAPPSTQAARDALVERGLLVRVAPGTVLLPRGVALALREGRTHRAWEGAPPRPAPGGTPRPDLLTDAAAAQVSDLLGRTDELLLELQDRPATLLAGSGTGVREVARLSRALDTDADGIHLLLETAHAAGLLDVGPLPAEADRAGEHVWGPTPMADRWWQQPDPERVLALLEAWWAMPADPAAREGDRRANALSEGARSPLVRRLRQELLEEVVLLDGAPASPEELLQRWRWRHPLRRTPPAERVEAVVAQARALGLVASPATDPTRVVAAPWLAVVPGSRPAQLDAGALSAGLEEHLPAAADRVLLQADLTAVSLGRPTPHLAGLLHLVGQVESRGGATIHRLTEASLRRALDAGHSASDVRAALEAASATGLPQPVDYLLREVAAGHGRVHLTDAGSALVLDDPALATRMLHDPDLAPLGLEILAPTVLASRLPAARARAFLRDHGYGPSVTRPSTPPRVSPRSGAREVLSQPLTREAALDRAERLLAAGEPTPPEQPATPDAPAMDSRDPAVVQAVLREAVADARPVWIWHTDPLGGVQHALVTPGSLEGGRLHAVRAGERLPRVWSAHRIVGVAQAR